MKRVLVLTTAWLSCFIAFAVDFNFENTGSNQSILIPPTVSLIGTIEEGSMLGAFFTNDQGDLQCAGSAIWTNNDFVSIPIWGEYSGEDNGFDEGESITWLLQKPNGDLLELVVQFGDAAPNIYTTNSITWVETIQLLDVVYGCTYPEFLEFNSLASTDDGSCSEIAVLGCTDSSSYLYSPYANKDDGSCTMEIDFSHENTGANHSILILDDIPVEGASIDFGDMLGVFYANSLGELVCAGSFPWLENGIMPMVAWGAQLDQGGFQEGEAFTWILQKNSGEVYQMQATYQDEYMSTYATNGMSVVLGFTLVNHQMGCTDYLFQEYNTQAVFDDGSCVTPHILGCTSILADNYTAIASLNDGSCSFENILSDISALESELSEKESIIEALEENIDVNSEPIVISLQQGWNMIGFTLREEMDPVASFQEIVADMVMIKGNEGQVYWPEFGFNGLDVLEPGQGYQVKMNVARDGFIFPDVSGQKMELTPSVPQWALEMAPEHPNTERTLVKMLNLLGQEVYDNGIRLGDVVLHLYSDGTVEKHIH